MSSNEISENELPEVITKEQLYRICHIGKSTALYLLKSGKIPSECTGKKTRCYKIKKADVIAYLENREIYPENYAVPSGWHKGIGELRSQSNAAFALADMQDYFREQLHNEPDVLTTAQICKITGYKGSSVNRWCRNGYLKSFKKNTANFIPKVYLIEFFCSPHFRMIARKSTWHIHMLHDFARWLKLRGRIGNQ